MTKIFPYLDFFITLVITDYNGAIMEIPFYTKNILNGTYINKWLLYFQRENISGCPFKEVGKFLSTYINDTD